MKNLKSLRLCKQCETKKSECPYPAAYNSAHDVSTEPHQACDEVFSMRREEIKW